MHRTILAGRRGSSGGRALSGYVRNDDGRWLAFSIIYNGIGGPVRPVEDRQDNACRILAAWPKRAKLPATRPAATQPGVASRNRSPQIAAIQPN